MPSRTARSPAIAQSHRQGFEDFENNSESARAPSSRLRRRTSGRKLSFGFGERNYPEFPDCKINERPRSHTRNQLKWRRLLSIEACPGYGESSGTFGRISDSIADSWRLHSPLCSPKSDFDYLSHGH